jgi:gluconokinase
LSFKQPAILALDIGSSSIRASLYDHRAQMIPGSAVKLAREFTFTPDGGSELDPDDEIERICSVIDELLEKASRLNVEISHVATCAFWHSLLGLDAEGRPTTKVLGWADTRSRDQSRILKERFDETAVHNRTGAHFHSSFWPAKLLWLRGESEDICQRTLLWASFADYLRLRLCGTLTTSISMASATGIFDQRKCVWDGQFLSYLQLTPDRLPVIGDEPVTLNTEFAGRWPRLRNALWLPAVGDGAADHVGSCWTEGTAASLMVGTSAALRMCRKNTRDAIPDGLWSYRINAERTLVGGALSDGGNLYRKIKSEFAVTDNAEREMRDRGPSDHGLVVLPFFFGERSTGYNEDARGEIIGLNDQTDPIDILRAAMEAVAYRLADIYDRLNSLSLIEPIFASGGALRDSPIWSQIIADVLGRDLVISERQESASKGAVLLALERLGKIEGIDRSLTIEKRVLAYDPESHEAYKMGREEHNRAYEKTLKIQ